MRFKAIIQEAEEGATSRAVRLCPAAILRMKQLRKLWRTLRRQLLAASNPLLKRG